MKTILFINHTSDISGAERSLLEILSCLDKNKWFPILIAPAGKLQQETAKIGVDFIAIDFPEIMKPANFFESIILVVKLKISRSKISRIIKKILPDIIHANTTRAMMLTPRMNIPTIWHLRDAELPGMLTRALFSQASKVAVISDYVENEFKEKMQVESSKFFYLPPTVNTDIFVPGTNREFREKHALPFDLPLIGMSAQFVDWKRHHLFLDALETISSRPWHAILAGAKFNSTDEYIKSITDRLQIPPLQGRVSIMEWVDDCHEMYQAMDLSVLTSKNEPFGRVVIESMACGVPVVAVNEGGIREIIQNGETGMLVKADSALIASAILELLDNKEKREKIAVAARQHIIDNYSHVKMRERLDIIYAELTCSG